MKHCVIAMMIATATGIAVGGEKTKPVAHRLLVADYSTHRIAIIAADGKIEWEHKIGDLHDLHLLPSGNVLFQTSWTNLVEVDPRTDKVVWQYDAGKSNGNAGKRVEVHAFQRLPDGTTMIAESGPGASSRWTAPASWCGRSSSRSPIPTRTATRRCRKLANGHYLVCHEGDGTVREYDAAGNVVWEYAVSLFGQPRRPGHGPEAHGTSCFAALRLPSGNTLIASGNGHRVIEVTTDKQVRWSLEQDDLPGIKLGWVTTLQVLPGGNIVLGNCHAGKGNPQVIEVTRDHKVVWTFRDFQHFGNATAASAVIER